MCFNVDFLIDRRSLISLDSKHSLHKEFTGYKKSKCGKNIPVPSKTFRRFLFAALTTPWLKTGPLRSSPWRSNLEGSKRSSPSAKHAVGNLRFRQSISTLLRSKNASPDTSPAAIGWVYSIGSFCSSATTISSCRKDNRNIILSLSGRPHSPFR